MTNKSKKDIVAEFEKIANSIKYKGPIDPHAYEEELEERWRKALYTVNKKTK